MSGGCFLPLFFLPLAGCLAWVPSRWPQWMGRRALRTAALLSKASRRSQQAAVALRAAPVARRVAAAGLPVGLVAGSGG